MEVADPAPSTVSRWSKLTDSGERSRADCHRLPEARYTFLAGHALVRSLLSHLGSGEPNDWSFVVGASGKPAINPSLGSRLRFNLSHTSGLVAAAACLERDVGVDVEAVDRRTAGLKVAERFFAPEEVDLVRACEGESRTATFIRIWTLKESYIKATGEGLGRSLQSFRFSLDPVAISFAPDPPDDPARWQFYETSPTPRHCLSVAVRRPVSGESRFVWRRIGPDEL